VINEPSIGINDGYSAVGNLRTVISEARIETEGGYTGV
jgi:hypothetical protein